MFHIYQMKSFSPSLWLLAVNRSTKENVLKTVVATDSRNWIELVRAAVTIAAADGRTVGCSLVKIVSVLLNFIYFTLRVL